jgi:hypothetical protein
MLQKGLLVVRYDGNMLNRCKNETNKRRFKTSFGVSPATMCKIYIDLQRSDAEEYDYESTNIDASCRI